MNAAPWLPRLALRPRDLEERAPVRELERDPVAHAAALLRLAARLAVELATLRSRDEQQQARGVVRRCRAMARELLRTVRRAG